MNPLIQSAYLIATALFILSLHWMSDPKTARTGVMSGIVAMVFAVGATWLGPGITQHLWIILPIVPAVIIGVWLSNVPLTAVPQRTALSHAFGGLAAGLVGTAKYFY
ncbi:MAG TPA: NAD(P)(+) transhydrogenase (Re/Si-specific) subunit beta, partial [Pirellulaceae bacterium]|nr:NAD(P)(+) transhydrogenase (Re/Si-specific) subunit beta [Pirellulaceae bacterium]